MFGRCSARSRLVTFGKCRSSAGKQNLTEIITILSSQDFGHFYCLGSVGVDIFCYSAITLTILKADIRGHFWDGNAATILYITAEGLVVLLM